MKISTERGDFDLADDFTIQIDEKNPITNDIGSQSVPVTIPCTPKNARVTGHVHRVDLGVKAMNGDTSCVIQDGVYVRRGTVNIVSASQKEGITLNIGFDNSDAYSKWKETMLNKLSTCPVRHFNNVSLLCEHMQGVYTGQIEDDFSVFPIMIANPSAKENDMEKNFPEFLNPTVTEGTLKTASRTEKVVVNNQLYNMSLPHGYGLTGFLKVWKILDIIFDGFGYELVENPFKEDPSLECLVVLNNTADACVTGTLNYRDLMPSCTVDTFLKTLYAKFGAVYSISTDTRKARMRLIKDIVGMDTDNDYSNDVSDFPLITYAEPKQLRLSSKISLEGATPETERLEDFLRDGNQRAWSTGKIGELHQALMLEHTTGRWYRWDKELRALKEVSSSFFVWDRKDSALAYEDIAGEDECVPMKFMDTYPYLVPMYLTGGIHRYTKAKTSDDAVITDEKEETPLAFLISFPTQPVNGRQRVTQGSTFPYDDAGNTAYTRNGEEISFALTYQFTNGLFVNFWKDYDAILRHANNQVDVDMQMGIHKVLGVDFLRPILFKGQRMLVDAFSYMLPSERKMNVSFTFKTLRLIGPYDLNQEQALMNIEPLDGSLVWRYLGDNLDVLVQEYAEAEKRLARRQE